MYSCYGAYITAGRDTEHEHDVTVQAVDYEWLDDPDDEAVADRVQGEVRHISREEAIDLVELAREIRVSMDEISERMDAAVTSYDEGDLEACVEALDEARIMECDHGDDPSTSCLASQLIEEVV